MLRAHEVTQKEVTLKVGDVLSGTAWGGAPCPTHVLTAGQAAGPCAGGTEPKPSTLENSASLHSLPHRQGRALPGAGHPFLLSPLLKKRKAKKGCSQEPPVPSGLVLGLRGRVSEMETLNCSYGREGGGAEKTTSRNR